MYNPTIRYATDILDAYYACLLCPTDTGDGTFRVFHLFYIKEYTAELLQTDFIAATDIMCFIQSILSGYIRSCIHSAE